MKLEKLLDNIKSHLLRNNINSPLALVGSSTKSKTYNDIDLLMIVDDIETTRKNILTAFKNYDISISDDAVRIDDFSDITISIALYDRKNVDRIINNYMCGKDSELTHRIWCLGYWIPESFIANLQNMKIINDVNNYFNVIKTKVDKNSIYARKKIVEECLNEIKIKYEAMRKISNKTLEYNLYKNDIILCIIRAMKIINGELLISFKRIDSLIEQLNCVELNKFIKNDSEGISELIELFKDYTDWSNRLYYGTWQLSGDFKSLTDEEIFNLIKCAKENHIKLFDTALVYGKGNVEKVLGQHLTSDDKVLTKVPAKTKPSLNCCDDLSNYYDYDYIVECIKKSCASLNRQKLDVCLLHNWTQNWNKNEKIINYLKQIKKDCLADKVGISLPNGFDNELSDEVLSAIDVIEAPYNSENQWILDSIEKYKSYGVEIILRSLFLQGKEPNRENYEKILERAKNLGTSIVVGMTTTEQIEQNVKILKRDQL